MLARQEVRSVPDESNMKDLCLVGAHVGPGEYGGTATGSPEPEWNITDSSSIGAENETQLPVSTSAGLSRVSVEEPELPEPVQVVLVEPTGALSDGNASDVVWLSTWSNDHGGSGSSNPWVRMEGEAAERARKLLCTTKAAFPAMQSPCDRMSELPFAIAAARAYAMTPTVNYYAGQ